MNILFHDLQSSANRKQGELARTYGNCGFPITWILFDAIGCRHSKGASQFHPLLE
jgi:hypothetical protein